MKAFIYLVFGVHFLWLALTAVPASACEPLHLSGSITVSLLSPRLPFGWYGWLSMRSLRPQGQVLGQKFESDSSFWWSPDAPGALPGLPEDRVRCLYGGIHYVD